MIFKVQLPIRGVSKGLPQDAQPPATSGDCKNVRPRDVLENKIRIGQRPALIKAYTQQIGGEAGSIVWLGSITTVD